MLRVSPVQIHLDGTLSLFLRTFKDFNTFHIGFIDLKFTLQVWNSALELVNCIIQLFEGIKAFWKEQAVWLLYVSLSAEKHTIMKGMYAVDL